jgi:hypothetical protein
MNWQARSPGLNPIEHVWSLIDQILTGIQFRSLVELERQWNNIYINECINMIEALPERINLFLKAKGGYYT